MDLSSWLISMVTPVARRVLTALGLGTVTYVGLDSAVSSALDAARNALQGVPLDVALIVARFGFFDYLSITAGGVVSGLTFMWLKRMVVTAGA